MRMLITGSLQNVFSWSLPAASGKFCEGKPYAIGEKLTKGVAGAEGGNRTRTPLRTQDFKSWASTNSATPARLMRLTRVDFDFKDRAVELTPQPTYLN